MLNDQGLALAEEGCPSLLFCGARDGAEANERPWANRVPEGFDRRLRDSRPVMELPVGMPPGYLLI